MGGASLKGTCRKGHPNIPENRVPASNGYTACRLCRQESERKKREQYKKPRKDD